LSYSVLLFTKNKIAPWSFDQGAYQTLYQLPIAIYHNWWACNFVSYVFFEEIVVFIKALA